MRTYTYRRTDIQREGRSRIVIEWLELSPLVKIEFRRRWGWMWGRWGLVGYGPYARSRGMEEEVGERR